MPCLLRREAKTSQASFDKAKSLTRSLSWLWLKGFTLLCHSAVVSDILSLQLLSSLFTSSVSANKTSFETSFGEEEKTGMGISSQCRDKFLLVA